MRFKKGSKVEVLTKEVPTGEWRRSEIISGNGHTYSVRGFRRLVWKPAVIARVFGGNNFYFRILGSNSEFKAHQSRLRVRQSWEDGNWFLVGKGSSNSSGPPKRKRSSLGFSDVGGQKKWAISNGTIDGKRILHRLPLPASEKVDAFVSPKNLLGERCMSSPSSRIDDTMSCASSVGSCSGLGNNGLDISPCYMPKDCENLEDYCSDADSYSERRCGEEGIASVELGTDLHRSVTLTWEEEEEKVTNLGRSLNISNDEHLRELRKLRQDDNRLFISCY
ncbi:hypothetical protein PTKIN_Ptkin18bG0047200 [Pterospermum kingtungense]